jgi:hypothetical protein
MTKFACKDAENLKLGEWQGTKLSVLAIEESPFSTVNHAGIVRFQCRRK